MHIESARLPQGFQVPKSFDQKALDSLRIERSTEPEVSSGRPYKWFLIIVLVLAAGAAAWAVTRSKAIEVETATATTSGGSTGMRAAVLNASG